MNQTGNNNNGTNGGGQNSGGQNSGGQNGGDWMNHPNLSGMDPSKLAMLQSLASQGSQKNQSDMMPFLMSVASGNKSSGVQFSNDEISMIIEVLKMGKPPAEVAKMEKMMGLLRMLK